MLSSSLLRGLSLVSLSSLILISSACGGSSEEPSLKEHVKAAMGELSYDYRMLRKGTDDYVVLFASDRKQDVGRFLAVGLPRKPHQCPAPPQLPAPYGVEGVTFSETGDGSLCVAEVDHRVTPKGRAMAKMMMGYKVSLAIWEQIYGDPACWADNSCGT